MQCYESQIRHRSFHSFSYQFRISLWGLKLWYAAQLGLVFLEQRLRFPCIFLSLLTSSIQDTQCLSPLFPSCLFHVFLVTLHHIHSHSHHTPYVPVLYSHCVYLLQGIVFPVLMYGSESWTIKKAECRRIDAFELWCWRRLLRVPWTARRSNHSILKEISLGCSLEGLMLKLKLQYFGYLM